MAINTAKLNYTLIYNGKDTLLRFNMSEYIESSKKIAGENFIGLDFTNTDSDTTKLLMIGSIDKSANVTTKWNSDNNILDVTIKQDDDFNTDAKAYLSISLLYKVNAKNPDNPMFNSTTMASYINVSFVVRSSNNEATKGQSDPSLEPYYVPKVFEEKTNVKTEDDPVDLEVTIGSVDGNDLLATIGDVNYIVKEEIQKDKTMNLSYTPHVPPEASSSAEYSLEYNENSYYLILKKDGHEKSSVYLASLKDTVGSGFEMPSDYNKEKNFGENVKAYLSEYVNSDLINLKLLDGPEAANEVSNTILSNKDAWGKMGVRLSTDEENFELTYRAGEGLPLNVLLQFPVSLVAGAVNKNLYTKQEVDTLIDNLRKELKPDS